MTSQTREGYAAGSVCTGGKTRAFHLATIGSDDVLPPKEDSGNFKALHLESQRAKFPVPAELSRRSR